ncbi:MAG: MFS transporter [Aeromicrobium sp.]
MTATIRTDVEISDARRRLILVVLAFGTLLYTVSLALVTPVLTQVRDNLGTSQDGATWVLTSYLVSAAALTPISGRVGDIVGKKRMLVIALAVSTLGLGVAALSTSLAPMIVGRSIQGLGGGIIPLGFGIVRDEFSRDRVGPIVSTLSATSGAGAAMGVVFAGPIVDGLGYHWLFWLPGIATALTALAAAVVIPPSRVRAPGTVAWGAALLLASWLVLLLLTISQGPRLGWTSAPMVACLGGGLVLAATWVLVELRARTPLIDLRMLAARTLWTTNLVAFLSGSAMFASMAFTTQLTQAPASQSYGFGLSLTIAGLVQLPASSCGFLAGMTISRLVPPLDPKWIAVVAVGLLSTGLLGLAVLHEALWHICVSNALVGAGLGSVAACQATLISLAVRPEQTGAANGVSMTIRVIGGVIGTAVMSSIVSAHVPAGSRYPSESGYTTGFIVIAVTVALGLLAALAIPRVRRESVVATIERDPLHRQMDVALVESLPIGTPARRDLPGTLNSDQATQEVRLDKRGGWPAADREGRSKSWTVRRATARTPRRRLRG